MGYRFPSRIARAALPAWLLVCAGAASTAAQEPAAAQAPPHIAVVDGTVTLEHENQALPATAGVPFLPGDRLRTTSGRVEVLFPDGSSLAIDEYSTVDLQSETLMRLLDGRLLLTVAGIDAPESAVRYQIDTPVASAATEGPGEYRVSLFSSAGGVEAELAVVRGYARLANDRGIMPVGPGERSLAHDRSSPMLPQPFNSARFDAFDRWAAAQRGARLGQRSAQYLPQDLHVYGGVFDQYGGWEYDAGYGHVWYPAVAPTWRPYFHGYWTSYRPYGWTWIGFDVWAWPTHHYGRWGYSRSRWFWIPDRHWGPAWVSWGAGPGYVGWCPLGYDGRPVLALSLTVGDPWAGWVVVPRGRFGHRADVRRYAVSPRLVPEATPLITQTTAPVAPLRAVPRSDRGGSLDSIRGPVAVPREGAGGRAVPRSAVTGPAGASAASSLSAAPVRAPGDRRQFRAPLPEAFARPDGGAAGGDPSRQIAAPRYRAPGARSESTPSAEPGVSRRVPSAGGLRAPAPQAAPDPRAPSARPRWERPSYPPGEASRIVPRAPAAAPSAAPPAAGSPSSSRSPSYRSPSYRSPSPGPPPAAAPAGEAPSRGDGRPAVPRGSMRAPSSARPQSAAPAEPAPQSAPSGFSRRPSPTNRAAPAARPAPSGESRSSGEPSRGSGGSSRAAGESSRARRR